MKTSLRVCASLMAVASIAGRVAALPEEEAAAARRLVPRVAPALVEVTAVISYQITVMGHSTVRESRLERLATVVSPTGVAVTALSQVDPATMVNAALDRQPQLRSFRVQVGAASFKEVKLRVLPGGAEIPARVVLKDPDLDIAFVAPLPDPKVKRHFAFVPLVPAAQPEVLGDYFIISRSAPAMGRVPTIIPTTLVGVTDKPRRLYLPTGAVESVPIFDLQGRVLGLGISRAAEARAPAGTTVLPASAIQAELPQAEAAAAQPPPAAPPPDEDDDTDADGTSGSGAANPPAHSPPSAQ